jgi:hypothetical protein
MDLMPMLECRSRAQMAFLGPIPPRTPGRSDAQVPLDILSGDYKYGKIPFVYFYLTDAKSDPAFGLLDIEVAVQRRGTGAFVCEAYAIGDGYQSGHGSSDLEPLTIELRGGGRTVSRLEWRYPTVLSGHMDAMTFSAPVEMTDDEFGLLDSVFLPAARARVKICLE